MAMNFGTPNTDFVQKTAESRRITRALVGDFTFDLFTDQHRNKVFLPRNMTKVLAFHDRNRTRGIDTGTFGTSSSRTRGPFLGNSVATGKVSRQEHHLTNGTARRTEPLVNGNDASNAAEITTAIPDTESMSQDCLKVKAQNGSFGQQAREGRRSIRRQLAKQHEDNNAQLYFDLINIRKKLNFKETKLDTDKRPRKRVRRETTNCHCHITIWDNREGLDQKEPIIRKSELCEISTTDLGAPGFLAEIKLQKPFVFKSSELRVPLESAKSTMLGVGDKYFLEIKIIPTRADVDWPPVPVLGRSEGDQTTGLGRMAAEKLQGALVVRYLHLPQAPERDVPLSVFFLHEGRTYRSKYGLEVNATWSTGEMPEVMMKHEEEETPINLWTIDEEGRDLGRGESPRNGPSRPGSASKARIKQTRHPPSPIKITFNLDAASAKGAKEFRKSAITGLRCPACPTQSFGTLEDLHFHFMISHSKYKFTIEKQEVSQLTNDITSVVFKITSVGVAKPRNSDRDKEPRKADKDLNWQAPTEPLDVPAYVNGDHNWVEQNWVEGPPKKTDPATAATVVVPDPLSTLRKQHHAGFLPVEHVPPFRASARKQYPSIKLQTLTKDKETMYTSVSHRQVREGEESRSESDDEMEDTWFVKKSLEALDLAAEKMDWNESQRLLRRKWNQARLREKLSHPRYLSDCLIRFVAAERFWLKEGGVERKMAFTEFIDELLQRRVINQEVVRDIWSILHGEEKLKMNAIMSPAIDTDMTDTPGPSRSTSSSIQHPTLTSRQARAEIMLQLPPYTCAICENPIEELRRHGVHCSEHDCEAPGVWYHNKCVRCKRKDKLGWKCELCIERHEEMKKLKGQETTLE